MTTNYNGAFDSLFAAHPKGQLVIQRDTQAGHPALVGTFYPEGVGRGKAWARLTLPDGRSLEAYAARLADLTAHALAMGRKDANGR